MCERQLSRRALPKIRRQRLVIQRLSLRRPAESVKQRAYQPGRLAYI